MEKPPPAIALGKNCLPSSPFMAAPDSPITLPPASPGERTVGVLLSTMRSGSTLLKALMAAAPDISDLPETNIRNYFGPRAKADPATLGDKPILFFKRPAWFNETGRYPSLPEVPGLRRVVLVRDAYENLLSTRKMMFRHLSWLERTGLANRFLVRRYWTRVNARLLDLAESDPEGTLLVRYEDIQTDPITQTARIFAFLGSTQREGVDSYQKPERYDWQWGRDDGGDVIKSLRVQPPRSHAYENRRLLAAIKSSAATLELRRRLGYPDLP